MEKWLATLGWAGLYIPLALVILAAIAIEWGALLKCRSPNFLLSAFIGVILAGRLHVHWFLATSDYEGLDLGSQFTGWVLWAGVFLIAAFSSLIGWRYGQQRRQLGALLFSLRILVLVAVVWLAVDTLIYPAQIAISVREAIAAEQSNNLL